MEIVRALKTNRIRTHLKKRTGNRTRTINVQKSNASLKSTEIVRVQNKHTVIVRVLKTYGNRTITINVRKSHAYKKRTEIVRVLKTNGNRTRT